MKIAAIPTLFFLALAAVLAARPADDLQALIDNRTKTAKRAVGIVAGNVDAAGTRLFPSGRIAIGDARKPDGDTLFEIGSITKVFTSLLLADMIERGEVKPGDPVARYLPNGAKVPARNGKQITLLNLSMQDSGLPRLPTNMKPADPGNPYADYDGPKLLAFLASYELTRDPGEKYEYSNLGVGLLGFALAHRAGTTYEQLVRERIFKPLHMDSSTVTLSPAQKKFLAPGYDTELKPVENWDLEALAGAGAIRSTANDMLKFLAANLGLVDTPLKSAMIRMRSVRKETGQPHLQIAMAWHILSEFPPEIFWHNGGTAGYRSFAGMDPAQKKGVIVLCNTSFDIDDIGRHTLNPQYPAPMIAPWSVVEIDPKILSQYEGKYQLAPAFAITVTARGDRLFAQATAQPEFQIFPSQRDEFFLKVVEARITFERGPSGRVHRMVLHQNGKDMPGDKVSIEAVHEISLDPKTLDSYAGEYALAPNFVLTITPRAGRLFAVATGQPELEIFASKKDEFFNKAVDAQISFHRDADGIVTGLTLHQNGQDMPGPRKK